MESVAANKLVKIGTRGSRLALWQANWVKARLQENDPSLFIELEIIKTKGDKILDTPLAKVGGKGLFVKEIEEALLDKRIDIAVHSMKDMPADIPAGLRIGATPKRETPFDALISKNNVPFSDLKPGSTIGTSSLRRASQIRHVRPDIQIEPLRGNLDTRIKKLETGDLDAIILAAAGIKRLDCESRITEYLDESIMLPAVGQGALCIEIRRDDTVISRLVSGLDDEETRLCVKGERAFLNRLEGGCQVPIAALGRISNDTFTITGLVANIDGRTVIKDTLSGKRNETESAGIELAERLLANGAKKILDKLKQEK